MKYFVVKGRRPSRGNVWLYRFIPKRGWQWFFQSENKGESTWLQSWNPPGWHFENLIRVYSNTRLAKIKKLTS